MKALKVILIFLGVLIAVFLIVALFLPSEKYMESEITINRPVESVFRQVNILKNWESWSPFRKEDPEMQSDYEGPEQGGGAVHKWQSEVTGNGEMKILESKEFEEIRMDIDMKEKGTGEVIWKFKKTDGGTSVTWGFKALDLSYPIERYFGLFIKKEMLVTMEDGLKELQQVCENLPAMPTGNLTEITIKEVPARKILVIYDSCSAEAYGQKMGEIYEQILQFVNKNNIQMTGAPLAIYHNWDPEGMNYLEAGVPVSPGLEVKIPETMILRDMYGGKVVTCVNTGSYETLPGAYAAIDSYMKKHKLQVADYPWEEYYTDPHKEPDQNKWETGIFFPIR